ncbi:MAG: hypothetical protein U0798_08590 [Gemmataceae bacterium]
MNDGPLASDLLINSQITSSDPYGIIKDGAGRLELAPNLLPRADHGPGR